MKKPTVVFPNIANAVKKQSGVVVTFYATIRDVRVRNSAGLTAVIFMRFSKFSSVSPNKYHDHTRAGQDHPFPKPYPFTILATVSFH
jgi:hypothetical protein